MIIFDEVQKQKSIKTTYEKWEEFRNALVVKKINYDDTENAKQEIFLRVFDDLFLHTRHLFEYDIANMHDNYSFYRAVKLSDSETPNYSRFIPDATKGGSNNRFSPKGVEWLYLAFSNIDDDENIKTGCIKEIRAENGDNIALCKFEINRKYYKNQKRNFIIDLTIADGTSYDKINNDLINPKLSKKAITEAIKKWVAFTYMKMLSCGIFVPLSNVDKNMEYLPFQCLAKYFEKQNLYGIIYKSTLHDKSRNIVLFDKRIASPVGDIEKKNI